MRRHSEEAPQSTVKTGNGWRVEVSEISAFQLQDNTTFREISVVAKMPIKFPRTQDERANMPVEISGWFLAPYAPYRFETSDLWKEGRLNLRPIKPAHSSYQYEMGDHNVQKIEPGLRMRIDHPLFKATITGISSEDEVDPMVRKVIGEKGPGWGAYCRAQVEVVVGGKKDEYELIIKTDLIANPNYLGLAPIVPGKGETSLAEAAALWRKKGESWQVGKNSFDTLIGLVKSE